MVFVLEMRFFVLYGRRRIDLSWCCYHRVYGYETRASSGFTGWPGAIESTIERTSYQINFHPFTTRHFLVNVVKEVIRSCYSYFIDLTNVTRIKLLPARLDGSLIKPVLIHLQPIISC